MTIKMETKRLIERKLLVWFSKHKREMPWRNKRSAYGTLVSEVMLQQTQIKTVIPYYERWMKAFPSLESFASASIDRVLKLWEGLGYYSRARNLHKTAQIIVKDFHGQIPQDVETLMSLPGIGRYTAGAIASIGFGTPAPIVDGNVARVLSRIFYIKEDVLKLSTQKHLYEIAGELVSKARAGDFNQSMMELGSLVCFPVMPQCSACPLCSLCKAYAKSAQEELPVKINSLKRKRIYIASAVIRNNGSVLVQKRSVKGIWGGLWEFPNLVSIQKSDSESLRNKLHRTLGLKLKQNMDHRGSFVHKLTHMDTVMDYYSFKTSKTDLKTTTQSRIWATQEKLSELSFPVPHQKILQSVFSVIANTEGAKQSGNLRLLRPSFARPRKDVPV